MATISPESKPSLDSSSWRPATSFAEKAVVAPALGFGLEELELFGGAARDGPHLRHGKLEVHRGLPATPLRRARGAETELDRADPVEAKKRRSA